MEVLIEYLIITGNIQLALYQQELPGEEDGD